MMKIGYIYKITNKVNNKIYIGKTTQSIERRFKDHIRAFQSKTRGYVSYLYRAFEKYGIENFYIEIIEKIEFEDERVLDGRERYYIKSFNSQNPLIGYNIQDGGEGGGARSKEFKLTDKQLAGLEYGRHLPAGENLKRKLSEIRTSCIVSQQTREKLSKAQLGKVAVYKDTTTKYIHKDEKEMYLQTGWKLGRYSKNKK